ncbi:MAG: biotin-dependent carboxyltransferase, partial [Alphaproteobacteria bacterium]|nr:biotin-dependent carboxyltransferase [Alphaproteobacteria bacterium]
MNPRLLLVSAGPLSTIQDRGRLGHQRYGVSVAGALDPLGLAAANALVGNPPDEAGIEMTLAGDTWRIEADRVRLAVVGDFHLTIDGVPAAPWRSHLLARGQIIAIGPARKTLRGYLAIAGGLAVPAVLGSRSTHLRNRLGGLDGGKLTTGAVLALRQESAADEPDSALDPRWLARSSDEPLRVLLGPQADYFDAAAIAGFQNATYRIGREADRMGYRLEGPPIPHAKGYNVVSDGIPPGAIQVPGNGLPIILLADRQTAGGYPKIGCVITPDLGALAQRRPGDALRFRVLTADEARAAHLAHRQLIARLPGLRRVLPTGSGLDSA